MSNNNNSANDNSVGSPGFTDEHSFGLFMEGLRSLQHYEDEAAQEHPAKAELHRSMESALTCLRECTSQFTQDLLPIFYLGVALSMKNQEVYVDRLVELTNELLAWGKSLGFEDMSLSADPDIDKPFAQTRAQEEQQLAQPFIDLGNRPWPLLEEAARLFQMLVQDQTSPDLARVASYNLAQVWARRGSRLEPTYLTQALGVTVSDDPEEPDIEGMLNKVKPLDIAYRTMSQQAASLGQRISAKKREQRRKDLEARRQAVRSAYEKIALIIQFDTLRQTLALRIVAAAGFDVAAPAEDPGAVRTRLAAAIVSALAVGNEIKDADIVDPGFKADLRADYFTKMGYTKFEFAGNHLVREAIADPQLFRDPGVSEFMTGDPRGTSMPGASSWFRPSAGLFLRRAAEDLTLALELKEHWNPAQIYLALVRRIQAGMTQAHTELIRHQKDVALAGTTRTKKNIEQRLREIAAYMPTLQPTDPQRSALSAEDTAKLTELRMVMERLEVEGSDFERRIANSERETQRFTREADELFAALQGYSTPAPATPETPAVATATTQSNGASSDIQKSA